MSLHFVKMIQFSYQIKAGDRQREFNFRKLRNPGEEEFTVNVSDERGNRIQFNMQKKDNTWLIVQDKLPAWIIQSESKLSELIEKELASDEWNASVTHFL